MEAIAKHEFNATADDELSFAKGDLLKITSKEDDQNWYKAECHGKEGFVPNNYIEMCCHEWFVGRMTRHEAEDMLLQRVGTQFVHPDGAFLVRHSESSAGEFSMSVKWYVGNMKRAEAEQMLLAKSGGKYIYPDGAFLVRGCESQPGEFSITVKFQDNVQHFKILRDGAGKYFLWVVKFESINKLIEYHRKCSVSRGQSICLKDMRGIGQAEDMRGIGQAEDMRGMDMRGIGQVEDMRGMDMRGIHQEVDAEPPRRRAAALYDFMPQEDGELMLKKGDELIIHEEVDKHWWRGKNMRTLEVGLFPANYIKCI